MEFFRRIITWTLAERFLQRDDGVEVAPVVQGVAKQAIYGIGTVTAHHVYQIKIGIIANIDDLCVRGGDEVARGAKLLRLTPSKPSGHMHISLDTAIYLQATFFARSFAQVVNLRGQGGTL